VTDDERILTGRRAIALMGTAGLAAVAAACTTAKPRDRATTGGGAPRTGGPRSSGGGASGVSCVLTPEQTEGPYHLPDEAIRSDITEGLQGVPLRLDLSVADASICRPIPNATVEVWHADAAGDYSAFGGGASSTTFLRGGQVTDAGGARQRRSTRSIRAGTRGARSTSTSRSM
jgi:Dioxygenase